MGEKQANQFGIHDMHGNVWEWCEDVYDSEYYSKPAGRDGDVACQSGSESRVYRGGSWGGAAQYCRSAFRSRAQPTGRNSNIGLRPAAASP